MQLMSVFQFGSIPKASISTLAILFECVSLLFLAEFAKNWKLLDATCLRKKPVPTFVVEDRTID